MTATSETTTLYGIKNCDTIKKAKKWLEANNIPYHFHDYRLDGIDRPLMESFLEHSSWDLLLNKRGTTWRQQADEIKDNIDHKSAVALMLEHPAMIKRPVLCTVNSGTKEILVGFKVEQYAQQFAIK